MAGKSRLHGLSEDGEPDHTDKLAAALHLRRLKIKTVGPGTLDRKVGTDIGFLDRQHFRMEASSSASP
nr:hypothetical protein [Mesorhizobium loti]